jgi:aminopeptidase N
MKYMSKKVKRLFGGFRPSNYKLKITPDRDSKQLTGTVVVQGQKAGRPSQRLTFHQNGLKITAATIVRHDKKGEQTIIPSRISHHKKLTEVRLHADTMLYPGSYTITMHYTGHVQASMHGVYVSEYETDGVKHGVVSTQFESHHAREAFPCIDEPEAKATFDLTLTSPAGEVAIANTPAVSQIERDGNLISTFETTPVMSTYLLAFVYGKLQYKETVTNGGVVVRVWATPTHNPEALDFALQVGKRSIEFFNEYYGVPYPLTKCDHVAIPNFSAGAMENWGLITYRERCLLADPATTSQSGREVVALVVCHEVSHQWFGNLVTMKWWNDLWLNESFANVMEYVAVDALFPEWNIIDTFVAQEGLAALRRDAIAGVQAIKTEVRHPDEIATLFDPSIVYAKGGRLLYMLTRYIGEEAFRKGLRAYFTQHAYGNTTGDDLWAALSAASGKDVSTFMNPWLQQAGYPVIAVAQQDAQITVHQSQLLLDPAKADGRTWPVPLLHAEPILPELLTTAEITATLPGQDYVRINQGAFGHYIVHYTNAQHAAAIAELIKTGELTAPERLMLLSDSAMLARAGAQSSTETLSLLEHYSQEPDESVWDIISLTLGDLRRFIDVDTDLEPAIKQFIRQLLASQYERLGWTEKPGERSQDTKLRAIIISLGVYAEQPDILTRALELFAEYQHNPAVVSSDLRSIVFGAAVRHDMPKAFSGLLAMDGSTSNVDLKQDILSALTLTKDPAHIALLLGRLKDSQQVRQQDIDRWIVCLLRSRYARPQAWNWLRVNWSWLEKTFAGDKSYDVLPRYTASTFTTRQLLEEYRSFFEPLQGQPGLTRNITMGIEEIENRLTWIERDIAAVRQWLETHVRVAANIER